VVFRPKCTSLTMGDSPQRTPRSQSRMTKTRCSLWSCLKSRQIEWVNKRPMD